MRECEHNPELNLSKEILLKWQTIVDIMAEPGLFPPGLFYHSFFYGFMHEPNNGSFKEGVRISEE